MCYTVRVTVSGPLAVYHPSENRSPRKTVTRRRSRKTVVIEIASKSAAQSHHASYHPSENSSHRSRVRVTVSGPVYHPSESSNSGPMTAVSSSIVCSAPPAVPVPSSSHHPSYHPSENISHRKHFVLFRRRRLAAILQSTSNSVPPATIRTLSSVNLGRG